MNLFTPLDSSHQDECMYLIRIPLRCFLALLWWLSHPPTPNSVPTDTCLPTAVILVPSGGKWADFFFSEMCSAVKRSLGHWLWWLVHVASEKLFRGSTALSYSLNASAFPRTCIKLDNELYTLGIRQYSGNRPKAPSQLSPATNWASFVNFSATYSKFRMKFGEVRAKYKRDSNVEIW